MALVDFKLDDIGGLFTSAREAITGKKIVDPIEQEKLAFQFQQLEQALLNGQIEINKIEAASSSLFVAGWRPFIGWICGVALAYAFIIQPFIIWGVRAYGLDIVPPTLDVGQLMSLVFAMLGMAGLRTYEKKTGVSREKMVKK